MSPPLEKIAMQQRSLALRLYRSILSAHRALPEEMRVIGNLYVREEFKLHKTAKPEHLQPFFEQWLGYLEQLRDMQSPQSLGTNIGHEQLDSLSEDQREKLFKMHDETARLFSGNYNAADMGLDVLPSQTNEVDPDVEMVREAVSGIPTVSVKAKE